MNKTKISLYRRVCDKQDVEILYDARKALQHKEEIDNAKLEFEEWERKERNKHGVISFVLFCVFCTICFLVLYNKIDSSHLIAPALIFVFVMAFREISLDSRIAMKRPSTQYTPDVEYYLATDGKEVLKIEINPDYELLPTVSVITENPDHSTTKSEFDFKGVVKTDLKRTVLNINEGTVYTAYCR